MCDYDHEDDEVRGLPIGELGNHVVVWLCKAHFEEDISTSYVIDQIWATLPVQRDIELPSDTGPYTGEGELINEN